jgi:arylsulfatase A
MTTIAAIIGTKRPSNAAEDSFNLLPALRGEATASIRPYLLTQAFAGACTLFIRCGPWKYLDHPSSGGNRYDTDAGLKPFMLADSAPGAPGQLYNLDTDPGETKSLYAVRPELVKELKNLREQSKARGRSRPIR